MQVCDIPIFLRARFSKKKQPEVKKERRRDDRGTEQRSFGSESLMDSSNTKKYAPYRYRPLAIRNGGPQY